MVMDEAHQSSSNTRAGFRALMSRYATGVAVIATTGPRGPHGMTANSLTSVSLTPPLLLFCVRQGTRTGTLVREARRFSVNILSQHQEALSRAFAGQEAFKGSVEWVDMVRTPTLADTDAVFVCDLHSEYGAGDHSIILGHVIAMRGRLKPQSPLVFYRGLYSSLSIGCTRHVERS
jgi:3-hydroxy-9,10-secoandrosta-1,3,5(10)-triene-9,17-dione monooxygenase reductase component